MGLFFLALLFKYTLIFSQAIKYNIRFFDQASNLTSINIRRIVQDPYGFMWIATQDGLFRHDSRIFEQYNKNYKSKKGIGNADVRNLLIDSVSNKLWISTSYGGMDAIDLSTGSVVKHIAQEQFPALQNNLIKTFFLVNDRMVLGCERGLYEFNLSTGKLKGLPFPGIFHQDTYIELLIKVGEDSLLIFSRNTGIFLYNMHTGIITEQRPGGIKSPDLLHPIEFYTYSINPKGQLCITSSAGLYFFVWTKEGLKHDPDNPLYSKVNQLGSARIRRAVFDKTGKLWLATAQGLFEATEHELKTVLSNDQLHPGSQWLKSIYVIYADKDNNIWLGCQNGLAYLQNKPWPFISYSYSDQSKVNIRHAYYLYPANDSIVWATAEEGLYVINKKAHVINAVDLNMTYDFIFTDPYGKLVVSNADGLFILKQQKKIPIQSVYPEFSDFQGVRINSCVRINDSCVVMGTENKRGILIWNYVDNRISQYHTESTPVRLFENTINNVYRVDRNKFLILSDATLSLFDFNTMRNRNLDLYSRNVNDPLNVFFDVLKVQDTFYLACYGKGVIKLDKYFQIIGEINSAMGLSNNSAYKVLSWKDSLLFISTNNGLNTYNIRNGSISQFYKESGLQDNVFEETSGNVYKEEIFVGGVNGFSVIFPNLIAKNEQPPVLYLNSIVVERPDQQRSDTANLSLNEFYIPNDVLQTNIYFSGINYINPSRTIFQYRIKELHDNWINLDNKSFIDLIGVEPNSYHVEVKAANEDGLWSKPIELTLIFLPKWYQTWWFKSIVALFIMGVLYGLYRYRLWQIRKEQEIRQRIASDLHDDIGSTLNSVKVFTNLAIMKPENNIPYLEQLKEGVQGAIVGVRDMVWVLDDKQDTIDHLVNRIDLFINPLAAAQDIEFEKSIDPALADKMLRKEEKRNLYLILKEALNNSIKYSDASTLQLRVYKTPNDKFSISIHDNGKGFDLASVQRGNGLNNLQYRAQQIKYRLEIDSTPGKGTLIVLTRS